MAIAIVGSTSAKQGATSVAFNTTGANLFVMAAAVFNGNTHPPAITDSAGNTWPAPFLSSTEATAGNGQFGYMWEFVGPTTATNHTWSVAGGAGSFALVAVSGAATSTPLDQQNFTVWEAGSITSETPGSVTPTQSNELCVAAYAIDVPAGSTFSVNGGYTIQQQIDVVANNYFGIVLATLIQTSAAATNPALTRSALTGGDVAMIATFKAPTVAAPVFGWYTRKFDDRWPFLPRNPDEGQQFFLKPAAVASTAPVLWKTGDGGERPILMRRNDDGAPFFRPATPPLWVPRLEGGERIKRVDPAPDQAPFFRPAAPAIIVPSSADQQPLVRPVVDQYQPAFIKTPSGVITGWIVPWDQPPAAAKADQYVPPSFLKPPSAAVGISGMAWWQPVEVHLPTPPADQYQPVFLLKPVPVVNTNAGMPWWQAVEVHLGPPPPQLDYSPSWDPQFIVQIIPPPPNPGQFTVSGSGVSLVFAEFFVDVVLTDAPITKRTN